MKSKRKDAEVQLGGVGGGEWVNEEH